MTVMSDLFAAVDFAPTVAGVKAILLVSVGITMAFAACTLVLRAVNSAGEKDDYDDDDDDNFDHLSDEEYEDEVYH